MDSQDFHHDPNVLPPSGRYKSCLPSLAGIMSEQGLNMIQSLIEHKMKRFYWNHRVYQELGWSQNKWKKATYRCQHQRNRDFRIFWQRSIK